MTNPIRWDEGAYEGDNRRLAMSGAVAVGAIFLPSGGGRFYRWRAWVTARMNPVEGSARTLDEARAEVETRFAAFLALADLEPVRRAAP